jgi:hypothetical protein
MVRNTVSLILSICIVSIYGNAQVTISLRRSFIDSIKNKITYTGNFKLVAESQDPSENQFFNVSCTEPGIGLPIVACIVNAKTAKDAVSYVHFNSGVDKAVGMTGVWRLWTIHAGRTKGMEKVDWDAKKQTQGGIYKFKTNDPPHVFEINPLLQINKINCTSTLKKIKFESTQPEKAFEAYSKATCTITNYDTRIIIQVSTPDIIYTDFWIKPVNEGLEETSDGRFLTCDVYNANGTIIAYSVRIGFVKGSDAEANVMNLGTYDKLHILAMPRINLNEVIKSAEGNNAEATEQPLPYEMIALMPLEQ